MDPLHINQWWIVGIMGWKLQGRPGRGGGSIIEPKMKELYRNRESWD